MKRHPPPNGGACIGADTQAFINPTTQEQIDYATRICHHCPVFTQCEQWVEQTIREDNNGRQQQGLPPRVNLNGIYAARLYQATDARGRHISEKQA